MIKIKYRYLCLLLNLGVLLLLHSCKKSENEINPIPNISIAANVVTEKTIGDLIQISPAVSYGNQEANFNYKWFKYVVDRGNNRLKLISENKDLNITADSLGTWLLRLEVTNVATTIMESSSITFNVISRSERGWYILKGTTDGNTDMDAFLTTVSGNQINRDIITARAGSPMTGSPVGLSFTSSYNWLNPVSNSFVGYNSCLMPVSTKEILSYRIRDEKILANTNQLFYEVPPLASRNLQGLISDPSLMTIVNNGQAHTMNLNSYSFLPPRSGDYSLSPYFTVAPYLSSGMSYTLGFDQKNESFVGIRYRQTEVTYFPDVYLAGSTISSNRMGGKLVFLENTDGTLDPVQTSNGRAYGLLKINNSNNMSLLGLNLQEIQPITDRDMRHSPVRSQETLSAATYPELTSASLYALNKNTPILYFTNANRIGSYTIDNRAYNTNLYSFPAGEEITYIKFLDLQYDSPTTFRNLVVATYTAGRYKIYRFAVLGNTLTPTGTIMEGTGRVKTMIYTSPNTYNFFNGMYRYY